MIGRFDLWSAASCRGGYVFARKIFADSLQRIVLNQQVDVVLVWPIESVEPLLLTVGRNGAQTKDVQWN